MTQAMCRADSFEFMLDKYKSIYDLFHTKYLGRSQLQIHVLYIAYILLTSLKIITLVIEPQFQLVSAGTFKSTLCQG